MSEAVSDTASETVTEMASMPAPTGVAMSPAPTAEEAAAIMAATEALWPRPSVPDADRAPRNTSWRFSSRWWTQPLPVRRQRPWR